MQYWIAFIACLLTSPLLGHTIGCVEYQLPPKMAEWKVINRVETTEKTKSKTVIYGPNAKTTSDFFAAHMNHLPIEKLDQASLEQAFKLLFPGKEVQVHILESDDKSAIYESTIKNGGKLYGLSRAFSTKDGTVILMYQTESEDRMEENKPLWIKAYKEAKCS